MTHRVLVVEPDGAGRGLLVRVLTAEGYVTEGFESVHDARILLDESAFDLAIVDEVAGGRAPLDEVRFLRAQFPRLPVVVTGTMLSATVLLVLLRLGVTDALPKPFVPAELRAAVARGLAGARGSRDDVLDYAAAMRAARTPLATGKLPSASRALARASSVAPLDADVTALQSLCTELEGRDADAARGYRATLALRHDASSDLPEPYEGMARLEAYGSARPVTALSARFDGRALWIVTDPAREIPLEPPAGIVDPVVVIALSITSDDVPATMYFREGPARAFALLTTDLRAERAGPLLGRLGHHRVVIGADSSPDLAPIVELRDESVQERRSTERAATFASRSME